MTLDQHVEKLEKDMTGIRVDIKTLIDLVGKMNVGLYGDMQNNHSGVIRRQAELEESIVILKREIQEIKQKNIDQDNDIRSKTSVKEDYKSWGAKIIGWAVQGFIMYLIIKGAVDSDALLKLP